MEIKSETILSDFDDKCTLLQAINRLNKSIENIKVVYEHNLTIQCTALTGETYVIWLQITNMRKDRIDKEYMTKYLNAFAMFNCSGKLLSESINSNVTIDITSINGSNNKLTLNGYKLSNNVWKHTQIELSDITILDGVRAMGENL